MLGAELPFTPYPFFVPGASRKFNFNYAHIPLDSLKLLRKLENHSPLLLLLGILPNQLRTLLKKHELENREQALEDLSSSLFWSGYRLWKKRKRLLSLFYANSAPDDWKCNVKDSKSRKRKKKLKTCRNPFHYLERFCDLSGQLRSNCLCSDVCVVEKKKLGSMDIRNFFRFPRLHASFDSGKLVVGKHIFASSRSDLIMQAHDRGKKRKKRTKNSSSSVSYGQ